MVLYKITETKMYECSCNESARFTEKEMKVHAQSHKDAGDKVVFEPSAGYSHEM